MPKHHVTHACGCTVTHGLVGNGRDRARKVAWLAEKICWECEKTAALEAAQSAADAAGLPALTGTEKQIAYGTTLRAQKLPELARALAAIRKAVLCDYRVSVAARQQMLDALILLEDEAIADTTARFWIEAPAFDHDWRKHLETQVRARNLAPIDFDDGDA
jgi:hypothetical protein